MFVPSTKEMGKKYKLVGNLDEMCSSLPINTKDETLTVQNMEAICKCCEKFPRKDYCFNCNSETIKLNNVFSMS